MTTINTSCTNHVLVVHDVLITPLTTQETIYNDLHASLFLHARTSELRLIFAEYAATTVFYT